MGSLIAGSVAAESGAAIGAGFVIAWVGTVAVAFSIGVVVGAVAFWVYVKRTSYGNGRSM